MAIRVYHFQTQVLGTAAAAADVERSVESELSLLDSGTSEVAVVRSVETALSLSESGVEGDVGVSFEDELFLQQFVDEFLTVADRTPVVQELGLVQSVEVLGLKHVEQSLDLVQTVTFVGPIPLSSGQPLNLIQEVTAYISGVPWTGFHVGQWLGIVQGAGTAKPVEVVQPLGLNELATPWGIHQQLGLLQTAVGGRGFTGLTLLEFVQAPGLDLILNQSPGQGLGIFQAAAYYVESPCGRYSRNSFDGTGGVAPEQVPLKYTSTLYFQSASDQADIIHLRNPETDNRKRVAFQRVNRDLFDGSVDVFVDDAWAEEFDHLYTITAIKRELLEDLFSFMLRHIGMDIIVKDWEGVSWSSIITNVSEVFTEDGEGYWTLDIELRSTRIDGEALPHTLSFVSTGAGVVLRPVSIPHELSLGSVGEFTVVTP